jgi:hypothetical protein
MSGDTFEHVATDDQAENDRLVLTVIEVRVDDHGGNGEGNARSAM